MSVQLEKVEVAYYPQPLGDSKRFLRVNYLRIGRESFKAISYGPEWSREELATQGPIPRWNRAARTPEYDENSDSVERLLRREFSNP